MHRRQFLHTGATALAAAVTASKAPVSAATDDFAIGRQIYKSLKWGMIRHEGTVLEKFRLLKELGYDGVELDSPGGADKKEALEASRTTGLPIEGIVNSTHWNVRHSDPDPDIRAQALKNLETALRDARFVGADSVLLVPGRVSDDRNENHDQVWERSIAGIRKALPLAEELGIRILIENVGNGFCYDPVRMAEYIDAIHHPLVGVHFDIGNQIWVSPPARWIRVLGKRIHKLDVKDRTQDRKSAEIGEGDAGWPDVRQALRELGYRGWAAAEVDGGGRDRLAKIVDRMNRVLGKSDGKPESLKASRLPNC
jgi:hexulose-6-phosphate isomerase